MQQTLKQKILIKNLLTIALFSIAFAYIEAAVVVYLRTIFYPNGFQFPLEDFAFNVSGRNFLLIETGREAATIILILTSVLLFGKDRRQRIAYFLIIFAVWDIFYYIWLKVLIDWPKSMMDWDILFLIPMAWASPVLAPVLVSITMLLFAAVIMYRSYLDISRPLKMPAAIRILSGIAILIIISSFCIAGFHINQPDYQAYFYWPLFISGWVFAFIIFLKSLF